MSDNTNKNIELEENYFEQFNNEWKYYDNKDITDLKSCKDQLVMLKFCLDKNKNSDFCQQIKYQYNICLERSNKIHNINKK